MPVVKIPPAENLLGDPQDDRNRRYGGGGAFVEDEEDQPKKVNPEIARRFLDLIEEVTDELMRDQNFDRKSCRADAIAMLIATSQQADDEPDSPGESPLTHLLREEQYKAMLAVGDANADMRTLTFMKV